MVIRNFVIYKNFGRENNSINMEWTQGIWYHFWKSYNPGIPLIFYQTISKIIVNHSLPSTNFLEAENKIKGFMSDKKGNRNLRNDKRNHEIIMKI